MKKKMKFMTALLLSAFAGVCLLVGTNKVNIIQTKASVPTNMELVANYDFSSLADKGSQKNADDMKGILDSADQTSNNDLIRVTTSTLIYSGNGSGGAFTNTPGMLKFGSGSNNGVLELTFSSNVSYVVLNAHNWTTTSTDKLQVNSLAEQKPSTSGKYEELEFDLSSASSTTVTITSNKRAFIKSIKIYRTAVVSAEEVNAELSSIGNAYVGYSKTLTATMYYDDDTFNASPGLFIWSATGGASVDQNGVVTFNDAVLSSVTITSKLNPSITDTKEFTPTIPTLLGIEIRGDLTTKTYVVEDDWSFEGLSVFAIYLESDIEDVDVTEEAELSANPSKATLGTTSIEVTAIWNEEIDISSITGITVQNITKFSKITSESELIIGKKYLIAATYDSKNYVLGLQNTNNRKSVEATVEGGKIVYAPSMTELILLPGANGSYNFYGVGDKALLTNSNSGSNNYLYSNQLPENARGFNIVFSSGTPTITFIGGGERNMIRYNSSSNLFSCYKTGQNDISLYSSNEVESLYGEEIASEFLDYVELMCDPTGANSLSDEDWEDVRKALMTVNSDDEYDFSVMERTMACYATNAQAGEKLSRAIEAYTYIVNKYTSENYVDFFKRRTVLVSAVQSVSFNETSRTAIIVISVSALISVGFVVYLKVKRRKENI